MRKSPYMIGLLYLGMGIVFTVIAIQSKTENSWNFYTIILMLVATFDFGVSIRMFRLGKRIKKVKK